MAVPTFPDYWVTGAIHHYVRVRGGNIMYLGTAEVTPQLQVRQYSQIVHNDEAGKTLPGQKTYDGQAASIAVTFSRWSRKAWEDILLCGLQAGVDFDFGAETRWSRGGLMFGTRDYELWQVFEHATRVPLATRQLLGLELGRYWPQVTTEASDFPKEGTQAQCPLFVWDAQPRRVPQASFSSVNEAINERGWLLFRLDDAAFPAETLVPQ